MKYKIGIYGSAAGDTSILASLATRLGTHLAKYKDSIILITGACSGYPDIIASTASKKGVEVWGFSPATDFANQKKIFPHVDLSSYSKLFFVPNTYKEMFQIPADSEIPWDQMSRMKLRNVISTAQCDAAIIFSGRWGTLNEFTNLYDMGKIIGVLTGTGGVAEELPVLSQKIPKKSNAQLLFSNSPEELITNILEEINYSMYPDLVRIQHTSQPIYHYHLPLKNMTFQEKLDSIIQKNNSLVCVGLDTEINKLPEHLKGIPNAQFEFNKAIVDATHDLVCAYKPNTAFYEAQGEEGIHQLKMTIDYIKHTYPDVMVILDAKRADIGNTNNGYVSFAYDFLGADAVTLHPYLGSEAMKPFLERADKGAIFLCRTSNPGAGEFQDLEVNGQKIFQIVAKNVATTWNKNGNCLLVVGATYPEELAQVRHITGDLTFLVPGVGAQGGDVEKTVKAGLNSKNAGMVINSSRGIIFASSDTNFAERAREEALKLRDDINKYRVTTVSHVNSTITNSQTNVPMKDVVEILKSVGAVMTDDHFVYTSGKHGEVYVNKDAVYPHTEQTAQIGELFAEKYKDADIDVVAAPALGGIILSQWTAYYLSKLKGKEILGVYAEKMPDKSMAFTRGYDKLIQGKNVLVIEDLTTTGGSVKKVVDLVRATGGNVSAVCVMVNRDPVNVNSETIGAPFDSLGVLKAQAWDEAELPDYVAARPINTNVGHGKKYMMEKGLL